MGIQAATLIRIVLATAIRSDLNLSGLFIDTLDRERTVRVFALSE
jgi:hypothetical protein